MLLLAALLHLAGAAALPVLHDAVVASSSPEASLVAVDADGKDVPAAPAHDESKCVICHAAHAFGAIPEGAGIVFSAEREAPARADLPDARPAERDAATLARAPPALS